MTTKHRIDSGGINLVFKDSALAQEFARQGETFVKQQLLVALQSVFDELALPDKVICIDNLALELGEIQCNGDINTLNAELQRRMKDAVRAQIKPMLVSDEPTVEQVQSKHALGLTIKSKDLSQWQMIQHYLHQGWLPERSIEAGTLAELLCELKQKHLVALQTLLQNSPHRQQILQRLERQMLPADWRTLRDQLTNNLSSNLQANLSTTVASLSQGQQLPSVLLQQILITALLEGKYNPLHSHWSHIIGQPRLLDTTIRYYGRQLKIRRVIVATFSQIMLGDTLTVLEPQAHGFVRQIIDQPQLFQSALNNSAKRAVEPTIDDLRQRLWLFTFGYLLVDRGSEFNRKSYLNSLLRQQARHHNISHNQLLTDLAQVVAQMPPTAGLQQQLHQLLQQLLNQGDEQQSLTAQMRAEQQSEEYEVKQGTTDKPNVFIDLLLDALLRGRVEALQTHWPMLMKQHSQWLVAVLMDVGQQSLARKRISQDFKQPMLHDVFALLAPQDSPFIIEFIGQSAVVNSALVDVALMKDKPEPQYESDTHKPPTIAVANPLPKSLLAYFSLTYLIVDRGSEFNRQSYLKSVINQLAAHHNMHKQQLLLGLQNALSKIAKPTGVLASMVLVVNGLIEQPKVRVNKASVKEEATKAQPINAVSVKAYQKFQYLSDYLSGTATLSNLPSVSKAGLSESLKQISRTSPLLLLRLWRDIKSAIQRGQLTLEALAKQLDAELFMVLLASHFTLHGQTQSQAKGLLDTIKRHIGGVNRPSSYFARVLGCALNEQPFDFEQILVGLLGATVAGSSKESTQPKAQSFEQKQQASIQQQSSGLRPNSHNPLTGKHFGVHSFESSALIKLGNSKTTTAYTTAQEQEIAPEHFSSESVLYDIIQYLTTNAKPEALSDLQKYQWQQLIEQQLNTSPELLLRQLQACWQQQDSIVRLIALLGQPLILQLLKALKKLDMTRLLPSAEAVALAVTPLLPSQQAAQIQQLKWQFIIQYLLQQGRAYNPHQFIPRFAQFLWQYSDIDAPMAFSRQLQQQLTRQGSPATQALFDSVASILARDTQLLRPASVLDVKSDTARDRRSVAKQKSSTQKTINEPFPEQGIVIENAGLVLAGAYLPMLFKHLNWLQDGVLKDFDSAQRAIFLLQYLATNESKAPEHELVLNKLLCGVELDQPIDVEVALTDDEKSLADNLVATMNSHWGVSPNTSVAGFKQTFLQRKGVLDKIQNSWQLKVQYQAIDILRTTKDIPWNYSLIQFKWSEAPIHVTWDKTTEHL